MALDNDDPDNDASVIESFPESKLKARRLIMLDRAFTALIATKYGADTVERALACIELAKELRIGMVEKAKPAVTKRGRTMVEGDIFTDHTNREGK